MTNKFVTILDHAGAFIRAAFEKVLPVGTAIAAASEPIVDLAFPGIAALFNSTVAAVGTAQATGLAATANGTTGPQKLASVVAAIQPIATAYLAQNGIAADATVIANWTNAIVAALKTLPAPTNATPVAPVAAAGPTATAG